MQKFEEIKEHSEAFLVKCKSVKHARQVKKGMHKKSFYGFEVRLVYKPELESVEETLGKLKSREKKPKAKVENVELPVIRRRI